MNNLSKTCDYEWYCVMVSGGRDFMEAFSRSGRPSTPSYEVKIAKVKETVTESPHFSLKTTATEILLSHNHWGIWEKWCRSVRPKIISPENSKA